MLRSAFYFVCFLFLFSCKKSQETNPITNVEVPNNPTQLKSIIVSSSHVVLNWTDSSSNEDGFLIERKNAGSNYTIVGTVNANDTLFNDRTVQPDSSYTYRVFAFNIAGNSTRASNELTVNTITVLLSEVTIGGKIWSKNNLDVSQYLNGDTIPQVTDPQEWSTLTTGAWCWYDNDSTNNAADYGKLYNWYAVNDARGLAPDGWRIPTESDWNNLVLAIDVNAIVDCPITCNQSSIAGGELKEAGLAHWLNPNNGANNNSGFTALPGGGRDMDGTYFYKGNYGHWWSVGTYDASSAFIRKLSYAGSSIMKDVSYKKLGYSVRVIKN